MQDLLLCVHLPLVAYQAAHVGGLLFTHIAGEGGHLLKSRMIEEKFPVMTAAEAFVFM